MSQRANILLVDDREENLLALAAILEPLGQRLVPVTSGGAALRQLLLGDFACILLDVQMPELDGFELAELIKQRERSAHIPIVFVTALSKEDQHVYRGYSAGAVDYVSKPFDPWVLRAKVAVFVELYQKRRQLQEQAALLRGRLKEAALAEGASADDRADLVAELADRLTAVEECFAKLRARVTEPAAEDAADQLADGLGRLRAAIDALAPR